MKAHPYLVVEHVIPNRVTDAEGASRHIEATVEALSADRSLHADADSDGLCPPLDRQGASPGVVDPDSVPGARKLLVLSQDKGVL
jgi:hypothetical protein